MRRRRAEQAGAQHRTAVSRPPSRPATSAAATPATVPPGELAARNLNAVLVQYMTQRGNLQAAVNHISQCQNVTANANVIAGIAASRTAEIGPAVVDRLGGPAELAGHKG